MTMITIKDLVGVIPPTETVRIYKTRDICVVGTFYDIWPDYADLPIYSMRPDYSRYNLIIETFETDANPFC